MIDYINNNSTSHIVTIEDPIEFLHRDRRSIINQREVGTDTDSYANALKSALRQDPDIILLGEMRDAETMEIAMHAAETGHLVFSTLHTIDAGESINRVVGSFPPHHQRQIRAQLSSVLKAVISQRLIPRIDGKGRVPAVEVMVSTARVRELIDDPNKTSMLAETIQQGYVTYGMQSFDQSLMSLVKRNLVSYEEAVAQSSNPDDFKLKFSGISSSSDLSWDNFDTPADEKNGAKDKKVQRF
jgi:twitching motility protein PilT